MSEFDSGHQHKLNSLQCHGSKVWTCSDDAVIRIWDAEKRDCVKHLADTHTGKVFGTASTGDRIWSFSWDREINVWDAEVCSGAIPSCIPHWVVLASNLRLMLLRLLMHQLDIGTRTHHATGVPLRCHQCHDTRVVEIDQSPNATVDFVGSLIGGLDCEADRNRHGGER
jgi:hypothetical protein